MQRRNASRKPQKPVKTRKGNRPEHRGVIELGVHVVSHAILVALFEMIMETGLTLAAEYGNGWLAPVSWLVLGLVAAGLLFVGKSRKPLSL